MNGRVWICFEQNAAENHADEEQLLKDNMREMETRIRSLEGERTSLIRLQGTDRAKINGLEETVRDLKEQYRRMKHELTKANAENYQLR